MGGSVSYLSGDASIWRGGDREKIKIYRLHFPSKMAAKHQAERLREHLLSECEDFLLPSVGEENSLLFFLFLL